MTEKIKLTFWGGVGTVTGANFLVEHGGKKILIDCGFLQGVSQAQTENAAPFPYDPASIDALLITHAHADHIGKIPKLVRDGFKGMIYSTPETRELSLVMLGDAALLLDHVARREGVLPLYDKKNVSDAFALWHDIPYHETVVLPGGLSVTPYDAGHILGSAMFALTLNGQTLFFTGDLGNSPSPLLKDTESIKGAAFMVMESVYGDRNHEAHEERVGKLTAAIKDTALRGGTLIIPAFTLERTQVLLYEINELLLESKIPLLPVFLDSPLAIKVTDIYKRHAKDFNETVQKQIEGGDDVFNFPKLMFTDSVDGSHHIKNAKGSKIIIAGSGMSEGGRVTYHEKLYLSDPKSMLLLVGYQAAGTLGRKLLSGVKKITIGGEEIPVHAEVRDIQGFSAHKDADNLLAFVEQGRETLKRVFVVMGEPRASLFLVQRIRDYIGVNAEYPERGKVYELEF